MSSFPNSPGQSSVSQEPGLALVRQRRQRGLLLSIGVLVALGVSACAGAVSTPTAASLPPPPPTATVNPAAPATATLVPPSPVPTATQVPSPTPTPTPEPTSPTAIIAGVPFGLELAISPAEQSQGLSDRESLDAGSGMLFPQQREQVPTFWMRRMRFPLDFVWIGANCTVLDVTEDVPPPTSGTPNNNLPIYSPSVPVLFVLELNAGELSENGLGIGEKVEFKNFELGSSGCRLGSPTLVLAG